MVFQLVLEFNPQFDLLLKTKTLLFKSQTTNEQSMNSSNRGFIVILRRSFYVAFCVL